MIVSCHADVGGVFARSATNAVHASFFDVATMRAEPFVEPPTTESTLTHAAAFVPKSTVAPGATLRETEAEEQSLLI